MWYCLNNVTYKTVTFLFDRFLIMVLKADRNFIQFSIETWVSQYILNQYNSIHNSWAAVRRK